MGELHGWKALIFLIFVNAMLAVLVSTGAVAATLLEAVLFMSLGYAFGNTVLKKHNKQNRAAMACSHDTCSGCECPCHNKG